MNVKKDKEYKNDVSLSFVVKRNCTLNEKTRRNKKRKKKVKMTA